MTTTPVPATLNMISDAITMRMTPSTTATPRATCIVLSCWVLLICVPWVESKPLSPCPAFVNNKLPRPTKFQDWRHDTLHIRADGVDASTRTRLGASRDDSLIKSLQQSYGESSRRYRRSYFGSDDWLVHRRSDRFLDNLASISNSGVVRQLGKEVAVVALTSAFVVAWNALVVTGWDDLSHQHYGPLFDGSSLPVLHLPLQPFTLSSPALGLLLVFRTNASYGRWSEARKAWGAVINSSRTILRLSSCWVPCDNADCSRVEPKLQRLADAVWVFCRSLQRQLLSAEEDEAAYRDDLQGTLRDAALVDSLLSVRHRPTRALREITLAVQDLDLTPIHQVEVEQAVTNLCDDLGACERIFSSPVPLFYTRHTARFLALWLILLPLALYDSFGSSWNHVGVIPAAMTIAFFLLGIEELAVQLEEPFSILPMQKMQQGIRLSVDEHVAWYSEDCKD